MIRENKNVQAKTLPKSKIFTREAYGLHGTFSCLYCGWDMDIVMASGHNMGHIVARSMGNIVAGNFEIFPARKL